MRAPFEILADASPWGCGGVLVHAATGRPLQYFAAQLTEEDAVRFQFEIGSCKGQAVVEALAILMAFRLWAKLFGQTFSTCRVASDSVAALGAMAKMASPNPLLNGLGAELALLLEIHQVGDLALEHIPGKLNCLADWCSRVFEPGSAGSKPAALEGAREKRVPPRDDTFFRVWSVAVSQKLSVRCIWAQDAASHVP